VTSGAADRLVIDASAFAAVIFGEPGGDAIWPRLRGATLFAPTLLPFELASVARKKMRRAPADASRILLALATALEPRWGIVWREVDAVDVLIIANATGLTTYDASYLWLAGSLGAELVTLDGRLAAAGIGMPL
jgi:predicted nucleic acid-binding protein